MELRYMILESDKTADRLYPRIDYKAPRREQTVDVDNEDDNYYLTIAESVDQYDAQFDDTCRCCGRSDFPSDCPACNHN